MGDLSAHFSRYEFSCPCGQCGGFPVEPRGQLVMVLEAMRNRLGRPLSITSGVRCLPHNTKVGGENSSEHLVGAAADVAAVGSRQRWEVLAAAFAIGVRRIGVGQTFVHIGVSDTHDTEVVWLYQKG